MLSSAFSLSMRPRSSSVSAPSLTRSMPSIVRLFSWSLTARLSCSSVIRPWLTRKWPRYSSGLLDAEERMRPSLKKIFFSTAPVTISSVPFFLLWESHCSSSSSCIVLRLPTMPMAGRDYRGTSGEDLSASRGRPPLSLVMAGGAGLAVGHLRLGLHGDEDELRDAPAGFQDEGLGAEVLQLQGDLALEPGVAPAGQRVIDP